MFSKSTAAVLLSALAVADFSVFAICGRQHIAVLELFGAETTIALSGS